MDAYAYSACQKIERADELHLSTFDISNQSEMTVSYGNCGMQIMNLDEAYAKAETRKGSQTSVLRLWDLRDRFRIPTLHWPNPKQNLQLDINIGGKLTKVVL